MRQRLLPGFDGPEADDEWESGDDPIQPAREWEGPPALEVLPGQVALFTAERELIGQLEDALVEGRFEEALEIRSALATREGESRDTLELHVLDTLGAAAFWAQSAGACVDQWRSLAEGWERRAATEALVKFGVLQRLVERHGAARVISARPLMMAEVVNFLQRRADDDDAEEATFLLRDALAAGVNASPDDFDDARFVDLLSEDRAPQWLAVVGALGRLWPVPAERWDESDSPLPPCPDDHADHARGELFWRCLRRTVSVTKDGEAGAEARKRMKQLDSALHARFMRQGVRRE